MRLLGPLNTRTQIIGHLPQCLTAVADFKFLCSRQLSHGSVQFRQSENRIVSEAIVTACFPCDLTFDSSLKSAYDITPACQRQGANKSRGAAGLRDILKPHQNLAATLLIGGRRTHLAGGINPRLTTQSIHHKS
jgi:hypothetical protein